MRRVALPMIYEERFVLILNNSSEPVATQDETFASASTLCTYPFYRLQHHRARAARCTERMQLGQNNHNSNHSCDELWPTTPVAQPPKLFAKKISLG